MDRINAEKKLRDEIEDRILGVEKHIEVNVGGQIKQCEDDIAALRDKLLIISGEAEGEKGDVQSALQKVRHDIEVTCETLLEEQMKLRGKVNEEFQAVHERLQEECSLREASEERVVESLEVVSQYFSKGVDLHKS